MAWETRRGKIYYYRKRRVGGRVVSEYLGSSLAARMEAADQAGRNAERQERAQSRRRQRELEQELKQLVLSNLLAAEEMAKDKGVKRRRGEWRKDKTQHG